MVFFIVSEGRPGLTHRVGEDINSTLFSLSITSCAESALSERERGDNRLCSVLLFIKYIPVYTIAEVTWIGINHPDSQRRLK